MEGSRKYIMVEEAHVFGNNGFVRCGSEYFLLRNGDYGGPGGFGTTYSILYCDVIGRILGIIVLLDRVVTYML